MKKILFVVNTFSVGGVENHLLSVCRNLDKDNFDIHVAFFREESDSADSLSPAFTAISNVTVHDLRIHSFFNVLSILRFFFFIRRNSFDVVQTLLFRADLLGILFSRLNRVPVIIASIHDASIFAHHRPKLFFSVAHFLMNYVYSLATNIIVISENIKSYFISTFPMPDIEKITIIYYGSDVPACTLPTPTIRSHFGYSGSDIILGSIGRIDQNKGQDILVDAFINAYQHNNNLRLIIAGHDDYGFASQLKLRINESGLSDKINFLGFRSDVGNLFSLMDIFVIPSLNEGLGLVVIEAMLSGKPVIASNSGALPELVRPTTGLLFSMGSSRSLSDKIVHLSTRPQMISNMSINASKYALTAFSVSSMIDKLSSLYLSK